MPFIREIQAQHDGAIATMHDWKRAVRGFVRVGAGPTFSSFMLPPLIKRFRRKHPGIEVFIESGGSGQIMDRLRNRALDLVFDIAPASLDDPQMEQVAIWKGQLVFVGSGKFVAATSTLKSLTHAPFILFQNGSRMESVVQAYLDRLNFRPKVVMRSDSAEAIKAMLRADLGISVLWLWNINADRRNGALEVIRTEAPPFDMHMAMIRLEGSYKSPPVEEFIALARRMAWPNLRPVERT